MLRRAAAPVSSLVRAFNGGRIGSETKVRHFAFFPGPSGESEDMVRHDEPITLAHPDHAPGLNEEPTVRIVGGGLEVAGRVRDARGPRGRDS